MSSAIPQIIMLPVSILYPSLLVVMPSKIVFLANLPDGTELDAWIEGSKFIITAVWTGDSLAEIGQQFAWLGAAFDPRDMRPESQLAHHSSAALIQRIVRPQLKDLSQYP